MEVAKQVHGLIFTSSCVAIAINETRTLLVGEMLLLAEHGFMS